jgi:hypothetical protein
VSREHGHIFLRACPARACMHDGTPRLATGARHRCRRWRTRSSAALGAHGMSCWWRRHVSPSQGATVQVGGETGWSDRHRSGEGALHTSRAGDEGHSQDDDGAAPLPPPLSPLARPDTCLHLHLQSRQLTRMCWAELGGSRRGGRPDQRGVSREAAGVALPPYPPHTHWPHDAQHAHARTPCADASDTVGRRRLGKLRRL